MNFKKLFSLIFILSLVSHFSFSQENKKADKSIAKAQKLIDANKLEDAEKILLKVTADYPWYGKGWDKLATDEQYIYLNKKNLPNLFGNMTVTVKDSAGNDQPANDSLTNSIMELMKNLDPGKIAFDKMIDNCKKACLNTNEANMSSALIRIYLVDEKMDTAVNDRALTLFNKAEKDFSAQNYNSAIDNYKLAIGADSSYYKARLYLGDAYYFSGEYAEAARYWEAAVKFKPNHLEPRKYLVDAYSHMKRYDKAVEESVNAMLVYPDVQMFIKWGNNIYYQGKSYDSTFIPRSVDVNVVGEKSDAAPEGSPWKYYQDALAKAESFCNADGIFTKPNKLTESKYLEVYAWECMLSKTSDSRFELAKKMQDKGLLEPFVLVGNFQYDFYEQYKDYVTANQNTVRDFFEALVKQ